MPVLSIRASYKGYVFIWLITIHSSRENVTVSSLFLSLKGTIEKDMSFNGIISISSCISIHSPKASFKILSPLPSENVTSSETISSVN